MATIFCVVLTLFFSAAAFALRHISWVKIEEAFEKRQHPERTDSLRIRFSRLVYSTAIYRLLANLGVLLCVVYLFTLARPDGPTHSLWELFQAFLVTALLLLVFAGAIPHAWGKHAGTSLLVNTYTLLHVAQTLSYLPALIFHLFDLVIRRLAGIHDEDTNSRLDEKQEELLNVVEQREKEGVVDEEEKEMIASVLEFRDTTVGEIMTPRTDVIGIHVEETLNSVAEMILREGHSRFPVFEESIDNVIGLLYAKDLLRHITAPTEHKSIRDYLRKPYFVPEGKSLRDLLHDFQNQKVHMAVVLDEYGGTAGIITIEDILEELVGEIVDEYETPQAESITRIDEHTLELDARVHVDELNDEYNLEIPEDEDYDTIGGFAFAQLGHIPVNDESFTHGNLVFTILDVDQRKINRLKLEIVTEYTESKNHKS